MKTERSCEAFTPTLASPLKGRGTSYCRFLLSFLRPCPGTWPGEDKGGGRHGVPPYGGFL